MNEIPEKTAPVVDLRDVVAILGITFFSIGFFLISPAYGFIAAGLPLLIIALAPEFRRRGESP